MSKVRCPNCDTYDTYNIKKRYAKISVGLFIFAVLLFWLGTILEHRITEFITAGAAFLAGVGLLIASLRMKSIQYCRNCEKRFYPDNVEPSLFDRFQ